MTIRKIKTLILVMFVLVAAGFVSLVLAAGGIAGGAGADSGGGTLSGGTLSGGAKAGEGADDSAASLPGTFTLSAESSFYLVSEKAPDKALLETIQTMDSMFAAAEVPNARALPIHYGKRDGAGSGDIVLLLDSAYASELPNGKSQGYILFPTASNTLEISAGTADGLWYGLIGLLQRCLDGETTFDSAITDAPDSASRTLLLDCGRKYYSRAWIENLIRRMAWQRYTSLHLHFSDSEGLGVESKLYPWLNEGEYLTFEDLTSICETARKYHIDIIPELDSPGHLRCIVERYAKHAAQNPDFTFTYQGQTFSAADEGGSNISNYYVYRGSRSGYNNVGIDLSNPTATAFLNSLVDEYADFFAAQGSKSFCIGGDELFGWNGASVGGRSFSPNELWAAMEHWAAYAQDELGIENGSSSDTFISYLNEMNARLSKKGFACRVWNDQLLRTEDQHVVLDPSIDIIYWSNDYTPMQRLADAGNKLHNCNTDWCYYVIRQDRRGGDIMDRTRKYCSSWYTYKRWDPLNCASPKQEVALIPEDSYAGGYFCIWADSPNYKTAQTVWEDTEYRTWANAVKLWDHDANKHLPFKQFRARAKELGAFPGFSGDCEKDPSLPPAGRVQ